MVHAWREPSFLGYFSVGEAENSDIRKEAERLLERQAEQAQAAGGPWRGRTSEKVAPPRRSPVWPES